MRLLTDAMGGREAPTRPDCLIVVLRNAESTYRHLKERFTGVHGVEVTLDRRTTPGGSTTPVSPDERRGRSRHFNAFGVLLVRR